MTNSIKFPNKTYEHLEKKLTHLPKLKQDIVKSVFQIEGKRKYGDLVENIIQRKMSEKK